MEYGTVAGPVDVSELIAEVTVRGPSTRVFLPLLNMSEKIVHYIILNNGILKSNSSVFPRSDGYISQYTP